MKRSFIADKARSYKEEITSPLKKVNLSLTEEEEKDHNLYTDSFSLGLNSKNQQEKKEELAEGESSFVYDLETTPEYGDLIRQLDELSIDENEEGDEMQNKAIQLALEGKNIFLTGKAGTGKSWVTRKLRSEFINKKKNLHVTAPTGIAAIQSNGVTLNSWGKFGLGEYYSDFNRMMDKEVRDKICKTDVLVIEEISMVNGHLFDVLECMVAIIRCYKKVKDRLSDIKRESGLDTNSKAIMSPMMLEKRWSLVEVGGFLDIPPFGGLQVILVGDFYQLPPIARGNNSILMENQELSEKDFHLKVGLTGSYAFESRTWQRMELEQVELVQVHRQNKDDGLFDCLNAMRDGSIHHTSEHNDVLKALQTPLPKRDDGIVPTELHSKNVNVDERNRSELAKLNEKCINFTSLDEVTFANVYKEKMLKKYDLEDFAHMPTLYASVMKPRPPQELIEAREKFSAIDTKMKDFLAKGDYGSIPPLGQEKDKLKKKLVEMENDHDRQSIVTPETFKDFIEKYLVHITPTPNEIYHRYKRFDDQLQKDYHSLKEHADKHFFQKECQVGQYIDLKKKSQVMLLFNVDVCSGLANGSRGIIQEFIPIALYRDMLSQENKKREESQPTGTNLRTHFIINNNTLPCLVSLLSNPNKDIRKKACSTISNITAGDKGQIQSVIDANIIPPLVQLLEEAEFDIRKEAALAISNATSRGTSEQIRFLVTQGCIPPLCNLLGVADQKIVFVALEGLENILKVGQSDAEITGSNHNDMARHIAESNGLMKIEDLQQHSNNDIYEKCVRILETYFGGEGDDEKPALAPGMDRYQFQSSTFTAVLSNTSDNAHEKGPNEETLNVPNKSPVIDYSIYNVDPTIIESLKAKISNMTDLKRELDILDKVDESKIPMLPYVKFIENDSAQIIIPQPFSKEFRNCGQAVRYQIPLTLAWAISIHKSQGMTIDWLSVDLQDCFATGQAYVAASRGRSLETMTIKNFNMHEVKTSEKVKKFYSCVKNNKIYTESLWVHDLAKLEENMQRDVLTRQKLVEAYSDVKCTKCGAICIMNKVKTNKSGNKGKYYLTCPNHYRGGHLWRFIS